MGIQEVSAFRGIQEVSAHRVRKELINYNLYFFAIPPKVDYGWPFVNHAKIKKYIYSHSTKYICTQGIILHTSNCIFTQLHGIVFIQLQGNDILVNCHKEKYLIHSKNIFYSQKV